MSHHRKIMLMWSRALFAGGVEAAADNLELLVNLKMITWLAKGV